MKLLTLDLSTASTGYAVFDLKANKLTKYGALKPKVAGLSTKKYPIAALLKMLDIAAKVRNLVLETKPDAILIEEINRGISRISQKSLDALHFVVLERLFELEPRWLETVQYFDSNGKKGWRGVLGLKLNDDDKFVNRNAREAKNKDAIVDWKVLAQRYVNKALKTSFDVKKTAEHSDIVDAICLGLAFVKKNKNLTK